MIVPFTHEFSRWTADRFIDEFLVGALKVTERFTPVDESHMNYSATIEDANVFTRAWTISMPLYRHTEPLAEVLEFKCVPFVEELLYKDLELKK